MFDKAPEASKKPEEKKPKEKAKLPEFREDTEEVLKSAMDEYLKSLEDK